MSTLTLTLRQPAQLGDGPRDDFVLATTEHLPGSAIRGAFAAAWIARYGAPEPGTKHREEFLRLFEGGVRFGALLPAGSEAGSLAVFRHKYEPDCERCQVVDFDQAQGQEPPLQCQDCGSPLVPGKGLFTLDRDAKPAVKRRTSVAIDESGVARRGQLFTRESLRPGQRFTGTLIADEPADLDILRDLGPVRVGGRRTTHGLAEIAIGDAAPPPGPQRLDDGTIIVRLRSPAIFIDGEGRPRPEPSPADLEAVLGVPSCVGRRWTRWQQVGGWHAASGLPKPSELAVSAGSVFQIRFPERPAAPAVLDALARRGIGLRRHEGFGDLAPEPFLREGTAARRDRQQRVARLAIEVAPLRGLEVTSRRSWPQLRRLLAAHAAGEAAVARRLRDLAGKFPDESVQAAMRAFLAMPPGDAEMVARAEGWL